MKLTMKQVSTEQPPSQQTLTAPLPSRGGISKTKPNKISDIAFELTSKLRTEMKFDDWNHTYLESSGAAKYDGYASCPLLALLDYGQQIGFVTNSR